MQVNKVCLKLESNEYVHGYNDYSEVKETRGTARLLLFQGDPNLISWEKAEDVEVIKGGTSLDFRAPKLKVSGDFSGYKAGHLDLPVLEKVKGLNVAFSRRVDAPALSEVEVLDLRGVTNFNLPALKKITDSIIVGNATKYPGSALDKVMQSPVEDLPILLIKYKESNFLVSKVRERLNGS